MSSGDGSSGVSNGFGGLGTIIFLGMAWAVCRPLEVNVSVWGWIGVLLGAIVINVLVTIKEGAKLEKLEKRVEELELKVNSRHVQEEDEK